MTGEIEVQFTRAEALRILGHLGPEPGNLTDRAIAAKVQSAGEFLPIEPALDLATA